MDSATDGRLAPDACPLLHVVEADNLIACQVQSVLDKFGVVCHSGYLLSRSNVWIIQYIERLVKVFLYDNARQEIADVV